jgi:DNA repair protein RadC
MNLQPAQPLRLREKLTTSGTKNLSDAELLAIFISSGGAKKSCLQLANELLKQVGDLRAILNAPFETFKQVNGLGIVRYLQLQAAREICLRSDFISLKKNIQLNNSEETHTFIKRQLRDRKNETFVVLFLDNQHGVISYEELFHGTINAASVYIRPFVERVLTLNAAAIIVAHNHPSGRAFPSQEDLNITDRLRKALEFIDVRLLDHLIIGDNEVYSIASQMKWLCH